MGDDSLTAFEPALLAACRDLAKLGAGRDAINAALPFLVAQVRHRLAFEELIAVVDEPDDEIYMRATQRYLEAARAVAAQVADRGAAQLAAKLRAEGREDAAAVAVQYRAIQYAEVVAMLTRTPENPFVPRNPTKH